MTELIIRYAEPSAGMDRAVIPSEVVGTLVRCKDCRHRYEEGDCTHYYWCRLNDRPVDDTDFCAWGERKGGDE